MKYCVKCGDKIPSQVMIDGKWRNLSSRKNCLSCNPMFGRGSKKNSSALSNVDNVARLMVNCATVHELLEKLGLSAKSGHNYTRALRVIRENHLSFGKTPPPQELRRWLSNDQIFVAGGGDRTVVRRRIIADNLIEYRCALCGCGPEWNGEPLSLRLDHINGVNNDHRLSNLRFVCPNCDSQLATFGSRNRNNPLLV